MPDYPEAENKPFCCIACDWILGESYREIGKRITQLRVYRHPRASEQGVDLRPLAVAVKFSTLRVNDGVVLCEHCGVETPWFANQTALIEMLERRSARRSRPSVPRAEWDSPFLLLPRHQMPSLWISQTQCYLGVH